MYSSCGVCTLVQVKDVQSEYNRNVKYNYIVVTTRRLHSKTGTVMTQQTVVSVTIGPSFSIAQDCLLGEM